jgi:hypothetical protein
MSADVGSKKTPSKGRGAPAVKVVAEASAACTGLAANVSDMPSSSRACAATASWAISWVATVEARFSSRPRSTSMAVNSAYVFHYASLVAPQVDSLLCTEQIVCLSFGLTYACDCSIAMLPGFCCHIHNVTGTLGPRVAAGDLRMRRTGCQGGDARPRCLSASF